MSRSADAGRRRRPYWRLGAPVLAVAAAGTAIPALADADPRAWLAFGKPIQLCTRARAQVPLKIIGASWGMQASGVVLCRDAGRSYTLTVAYMNIRIDPSGGGWAAPEAAHFEWLGLTLYRPDSGGGTAWLYDAACPVDGRLLRQDTGRLVLGRVAFRVPKIKARPATNMLLYLTFDRKLIALNLL